MSSEQDFLIEIRKEFLDEAAFLLEQCEESYLKLEHPDHREEELAKIFRLAHSMKGGGAAVGFNDLAAFAHVVEDCLSVLRTCPQNVNTRIISALLNAGDAFKVRIEMLKSNDSNPWKIQEIEKEIREITREIQIQSKQLDQAPPASGPQSSGSQLPDPQPTGPQSSGKKNPILELWDNLASVTHHEIEAHQEEEHAKSTENQIPLESSEPAKVSSSQTDKPATTTGTSIKLDIERVENVLNIVGELVVIKSQLMNQCASYSQDLRLAAIVSLMDRTVRDLQDKTLSMRMTPLKGLFLKTQRMIRDLSLKLGKPVEFKMSGEDTELDRTMVEFLSDPLMHIIRNSLDHGIESHETRKSSGKSEKGMIHLSAQQLSGRVVIKVKDDGAGINRARVLQKAKEKGLVSQAVNPSSLKEKEIFNFIFMPGFSTAEKVTDVSGRGVGMDVVKTNIEKLKGNIDIESIEGNGTCLTISIPLTTSITDGMIVEVGMQAYILPMDVIKELVNCTERSLFYVEANRKVINHRGKIIPLVDLSQILPSDMTSTSVASEQVSSGNMLAVVEVGARTIGLRLSRILGQTQVVLKSLSAGLQGVRGVSGVAILGDGKVALVLDPVGLVEYTTTVAFSEPPMKSIA